MGICLKTNHVHQNRKGIVHGVVKLSMADQDKQSSFPGTPILICDQICAHRKEVPRPFKLWVSEWLRKSPLTKTPKFQISELDFHFIPKINSDAL